MDPPAETTLQVGDLRELEPYLVKDTPVPGGAGTFVVLLLESPHTMEVCRRRPLAGNAGLSVTRTLGQKLGMPDAALNCPFGEVVTNRANIGIAALRRIRVMNVCQLPMQLKTYPPYMRQRFGQLLRRLNTLRGPGAADRKNRVQTRWVKDALVADLTCRIDRIGGRAFLIPCGNVARDFFRRADLPNVQRSALEVAHPSRGAWLSDEEGEVQELATEILNKLGL